MIILSLDPSVNNCGWALLDTEGKTTKQRWRTGLIKPEGRNYAMKCTHIVQELVAMLASEEFELGLLVTEWPTFFNSSKGHMAARQNYTVDLAGICAFVAGSLGMDHRSWFLSTATEWKGTVSKNITERKFLRHFGKTYFHTVSEHEIDATMLLHWFVKVKATSLGVDLSAWPELA